MSESIFPKSIQKTKMIFYAIVILQFRKIVPFLIKDTAKQEEARSFILGQSIALRGHKNIEKNLTHYVGFFNCI